MRFSAYANNFMTDRLFWWGHPEAKKAHKVLGPSTNYKFYLPLLRTNNKYFHFANSCKNIYFLQ
jgi:hypothetical protein